MCTTIGCSIPISGSGKGARGWLTVDQVNLSYDHPHHAPLEHAVNIDFVNSADACGTRIAIELTREAARALARRLLAIVDEADAYEALGERN
jgi:hypothetical protein